jgi:Domain of unknown function (DUF4149)
VKPASPVALLLAAWLGAGILFAAVVAPAAFAVLPSRTLAGTLVGRVLPTVFVAGIVVALVSALLDRPQVGRSHRLRRVALIVAAIACAVAQFVVGPRIERVRSEIGGPLERLAQGDPRRAAFGRLHAISVGWLGLAMISAATVVVLVSMSPTSRAADT